MGKAHPLYGRLIDAWQRLDDDSKKLLVKEAEQLATLDEYVAKVLADIFCTEMDPHETQASKPSR